MVSFASYVIKTWDSRELFRLLYVFHSKYETLRKVSPWGTCTHAAFLIRVCHVARWNKLTGSDLKWH